MVKCFVTLFEIPSVPHVVNSYLILCTLCTLHALCETDMSVISVHYPTEAVKKNLKSLFRKLIQKQNSIIQVD